MIEKLYELQATNHYGTIKSFYDTENEGVFSVRSNGEKICCKTDDAITTINHFEVKSVILTNYFISMCYNELKKRHSNEELTQNEMFLWKAIQDRELYTNSLKKNLKDEYRKFIASFRNNVDYDVLIDDVKIHEQLILTKLFHVFCIKDLFYSYDIIKKVYDIGISSDNTFYDFLIEVFYKYSKSYNPFDNDNMVAFFERIVKEEEMKKNGQ